MSIVVAVRKGKYAAIASDLQTTYGSTICPGEMRPYPRNIRRVGEAYIGLVGSIAHFTSLWSLVASKPDLFNFSSGDAIAETLRKIHPLLRDEYYLLTTEDDDNQEYESIQMDGLIVSKSGIYSFSSYREVSEYNMFWATGSGTEYSLGAMEATYATEQSAKKIAECGVNAACKFDTACGLPLESYELELEGT